MPIDNYGVLVGAALERRREPGEDTPHYQILLDAAGAKYRIAVNVQSGQAPSELLYAVYEDFDHPILAGLADLPDGWNLLASKPGGLALDYIRGNLLRKEDTRLLPADIPGESNDLSDMLDAQVLRAIADPDARLYAFGEKWGPENTPDKIFKFTPGQGVHNIHMNQGNSPKYARDDGVWQDGGLLIHFPAAQRWVAVFLGFQSQAWHTDDTTGHTLALEPEPSHAKEPGTPTAQAKEATIQVVAAMVNPVGGAPEAESVTLINASAEEVSLFGWNLADKMKNRHPLPAVQLAAGETLRVPVAPPFALGNKGGIITVLDPAGLKVHGVAYTGFQAAQEGWTVVP